MEYIDMHSHILPGLDDGSKNMEMTLAMLRVAVEEGIGTIYTTPHCMPGKGHPTLVKVEERIRLVQEAAEAEGIHLLFLWVITASSMAVPMCLCF